MRSEKKGGLKMIKKEINVLDEIQKMKVEAERIAKEELENG